MARDFCYGTKEGRHGYIILYSPIPNRTEQKRLLHTITATVMLR